MFDKKWCLHICNHLEKDNSYRQSDCISEKLLKCFFQRGVYTCNHLVKDNSYRQSDYRSEKTLEILFPTRCLHICNYLVKDNSYIQSDCRSEKPLKCFLQRGVYIYAIISEMIIARYNLIADLKSP